MKTTIYRFSWLMMLIAGAQVAPARLSAQRTDQTRNHIVKPGDTLWKLSAAYLGDGNRWREILAINPALKNRSALSIGTTLKIPASRPAAVASSSPASTPAQSARPKEPSHRPYITDTIKRTVFFGAKPAGGFVHDTARRVSTDSGVPARVFEYLSAPFVADDDMLDGGGRCVSVGPTSASEARGVLLHGKIEVQMPAGVAVDTAARWLLVRRGPLLEGLGPVAIPTGVVRLTSTDAAVNAEVVAQYDAMSCNDVLIPASSAPPAKPTLRSESLVAVDNGPRGVVVWVPSESLLPTLQHALILSIGTDVGVRLGDRVTVFGGNNAVVASADIVRVDERTATALVVRQSLGSLSTGLRVRVTEKLP